MAARSAGKARVANRSAGKADVGRYRSPRELKEILDAVLTQVDADPDQGPRLRAVDAPLRIEVTDPAVAINIAPATRAGHTLRWDFSKSSRMRPVLAISMDGEFANRFFQGRESVAIAITRGRIRATVDEPGAALRFFPAARALFSRYRDLVAESYPHLALD